MEAAELVNPELAQALSTRTEFTEAEFKAFKVKEVRSDQYIQSGGTYFKPASVTTAVARLVAPLAPDDSLTVGKHVLAVDKYRLWKAAVVARVGDTIDVKIQGWAKQADLPRTKALAVTPGGAGALLRAAAGAGDAVLVEELLANGVSALVADERANTPLHVAAAAGHARVCRALLAAGADKDVYNAQNAAAWQLAQANKRHAVDRLFNPTLSDREFTEEACTANERLKAAWAGDVAALGRTHDAGAITALMVACRAKQRTVVEALLPAAMDAQSGSGCTALYLAAEAGDEHIVGLLLGAGANVALAASDGSLPLMQACRFGHERCALAIRRVRTWRRRTIATALMLLLPERSRSALNCSCRQLIMRALQGVLVDLLTAPALISSRSLPRTVKLV